MEGGGRRGKWKEGEEEGGVSGRSGKWKEGKWKEG